MEGKKSSKILVNEHETVYLTIIILLDSIAVVGSRLNGNELFSNNHFVAGAVTKVFMEAPSDLWSFAFTKWGRDVNVCCDPQNWKNHSEHYCAQNTHLRCTVHS